QPVALARHHLLPVDPPGGDVLARRAGCERVAFAPQVVDAFDGIEAEGPFRTAVVHLVVVFVADDAQLVDLGDVHRQLGHAAARRVDLDNRPTHGFYLRGAAGQ